jgi:hypothetical protein
VGRRGEAAAVETSTEAWGWSRLVIYEKSETIVQWPTFMQYLKDYFNRNVAFLGTMSAATTCVSSSTCPYVVKIAGVLLTNLFASL